MASLDRQFPIICGLLLVGASVSSGIHAEAGVVKLNERFLGGLLLVGASVSSGIHAEAGVVKLNERFLVNPSSAVSHLTSTTPMTTTPTTATPGPFNCNFDRGLCGWSQDKKDAFDWSRVRGPTGTSGTQPSHDHTSGHGYYIYIETNGRTQGAKARITSPLVPTNTQGQKCLTLWYHMYGPNVDRLNVYIVFGLSIPPFAHYSKHGTQGNRWKQATMNINTLRPFNVVIEGTRGNGYRGDIAIDDVAIADGRCIPTSACARNPCIHGSCVNSGNGQYHCNCEPGYTDNNCFTDIDDCQPSPCLHGQCLDGVNTYTCVCNPGYTGTQCDTDINECVSNPCHHGRCYAGLNGFTCICDYGYTGMICDTMTGVRFGPTCYDCRHYVDDPAHCRETVRCNPDESCSVVESSPVAGIVRYDLGCTRNLRCSVILPFLGGGPCTRCCSGSLCNGHCTTTTPTVSPASDMAEADVVKLKERLLVINECMPNPCHHGTCINWTNGFICQCDMAYTGITCDTIINECMPNPCHHGKCINWTNGFICQCDMAYTGITCDTIINECMPNPCHHGKCINWTNGFICQCDMAYTGLTCDTKKHTRDCKDIKDLGITSKDNVFTVKDATNSDLDIKCDMTTDGGGWTVLLYRDSNSVNFDHRDSWDYALGFGHINGDYWIGLENMHSLTSDGRRYQLRIEVYDAGGHMYYEIYDDFGVDGRRDFRLHVGAGRGTAGDSLSNHTGYGFTTWDEDRDNDSGVNCATYLHAGWWFHHCYDSCLTCPYIQPGTYNCASMSWNSLGYCIALSKAVMMVRPM